MSSKNHLRNAARMVQETEELLYTLVVDKVSV